MGTPHSLNSSKAHAMYMEQTHSSLLEGVGVSALATGPPAQSLPAGPRNGTWAC